MKRTYFCTTVALTAVLAGCSSSSGPTFNAYQVNPKEGQATYRVECHGLLEGQDVCKKKADEICGDQGVRPVEPVTPYGKTNPDVRTLTFQCGAALVNPVALVPAAEPMVVKRVDLAADANFETDRAELTVAARQKLDKLLAESRDMSFRRIDVDGYTDARASIEYNLDLSNRRAMAVAQYLRDRGLKVEVWAVRGHGKADPIDTNDTAEGRARNRRVEIKLAS